MVNAISNEENTQKEWMSDFRQSLSSDTYSKIDPNNKTVEDIRDRMETELGQWWNTTVPQDANTYNTLRGYEEFYYRLQPTKVFQNFSPEDQASIQNDLDKFNTLINGGTPQPKDPSAAKDALLQKFKNTYDSIKAKDTYYQTAYAQFKKDNPKSTNLPTISKTLTDLNNIEQYLMGLEDLINKTTVTTPAEAQTLVSTLNAYTNSSTLTNLAFTYDSKSGVLAYTDPNTTSFINTAQNDEHQLNSLMALTPSSLQNQSMYFDICNFRAVLDKQGYVKNGAIQPAFKELVQKICTELKGQNVTTLDIAFSQLSDLKLNAGNVSISLFPDHPKAWDIFKNTLKENGIKMHLSFGGAGATTDNFVLPGDQTKTADALVNWMKDNDVSGLDFDIEGHPWDSGPSGIALANQTLKDKQFFQELEKKEDADPSEFDGDSITMLCEKSTWGDNPKTYLSDMKALIEGGCCKDVNFMPYADGGTEDLTLDGPNILDFLKSDSKLTSSGIDYHIGFAPKTQYERQTKINRGAAAAKEYRDFLNSAGSLANQFGSIYWWPADDSYRYQPTIAEMEGDWNFLVDKTISTQNVYQDFNDAFSESKSTNTPPPTAPTTSKTHEPTTPQPFVETDIDTTALPDTKSSSLTEKQLDQIEYEKQLKLEQEIQAQILLAQAH